MLEIIESGDEYDSFDLHIDTDHYKPEDLHNEHEVMVFLHSICDMSI